MDSQKGQPVRKQCRVIESKTDNMFKDKWSNKLYSVSLTGGVK